MPLFSWYEMSLRVSGADIGWCHVSKGPLSQDVPHGLTFAYKLQCKYDIVGSWQGHVPGSAPSLDPYKHHRWSDFVDQLVSCMTFGAVTFLVSTVLRVIEMDGDLTRSGYGQYCKWETCLS